MSGPIENRCRAIALGRVNSFSPSSPWMRPKPESPTPPNGRDGKPAKDNTELTLAIPLRTRRAGADARLFPENPAPRPDDDPVAFSIASSPDAPRGVGSTGPHTPPPPPPAASAAAEGTTG